MSKNARRKSKVKMLQIPEKTLHFDDKAMGSMSTITPTKTINGKTEPIIGKYGGSYSGWEGDEDWGSYRTCKHWRKPIKAGDFTLFVSAHSDSPIGKKPSEWEDQPDLGIYLADAWTRKLGGVMSCGIDTPITPWYPFVFFDWADFGTMSDYYYKILVEYAVEHIKNGERVEVGCLGAHGRTGTLVAGIIASLENLDAKTAIDETRLRICSQAIETWKQEDMVYYFLDETPPAPPPVSKTPLYNQYPGSVSTDVSKINKGFASKPCICNHPKSRHKGRTSCNLCNCPSYLERVPESTSVNKYMEKCPKCTHEMYRHSMAKGCSRCGCDEDITPKKVPSLGEKIRLDRKAKGMKVCLCGHLDSTHTYLDKGQCVLCECPFFDDSDNHSSDYVAEKQYTYPARPFDEYKRYLAEKEAKAAAAKEVESITSTQITLEDAVEGVQAAFKVIDDAVLALPNVIDKEQEMISTSTLPWGFE